MPELPQPGIFISYRHADALPHARLLQVMVSERFPGARVFMDLDSIEAGLDFAEVISEAVNSSAVMLVLIGPQWATLAGEEGRRRLDDPDDYVRFEIRTALKRGIRVIPVLIGGARALEQQQLPRGLRRLARLNALEMSCDHRYQYDADRLLSTIEKALSTPAGPGDRFPRLSRLIRRAAASVMLTFTMATLTATLARQALTACREAGASRHRAPAA